MFAQCLRRFVHCLRSISMFAHVLYVCAIQMLHALNEIIPHLKTSSRGAEAPTCPETSPWPTRSYAIAWSRRIYLQQSQPDHLDSTFRRGRRNLPDSSQLVQMEWFQCPLPALVTAFPGWNRQESHRPAVPAEIICQSISCR